MHNNNNIIDKSPTTIAADKIFYVFLQSFGFTCARMNLYNKIIIFTVYTVADCTCPTPLGV